MPVVCFIHQCTDPCFTVFLAPVPIQILSKPPTSFSQKLMQFQSNLQYLVMCHYPTTFRLNKHLFADRDGSCFQGYTQIFTTILKTSNLFNLHGQEEEVHAVWQPVLSVVICFLGTNQVLE